MIAEPDGRGLGLLAMAIVAVAATRLALVAVRLLPGFLRTRRFGAARGGGGFLGLSRPGAIALLSRLPVAMFFTAMRGLLGRRSLAVPVDVEIKWTFWFFVSA